MVIAPMEGAAHNMDGVVQDPRTAVSAVTYNAWHGSKVVSRDAMNVAVDLIELQTIPYFSVTVTRNHL